MGNTGVSQLLNPVGLSLDSTTCGSAIGNDGTLLRLLDFTLGTTFIAQPRLRRELVVAYCSPQAKGYEMNSKRKKLENDEFEIDL